MNESCFSKGEAMATMPGADRGLDTGFAKMHAAGVQICKEDAGNWEGCRPADTKRLCSLEAGNSTLRKLVAERCGEAPPVLNRETMRLLEELGPDFGFMQELFRAFIRDIQQLLRRLDRDGECVPAGEFRALVHALKGSVLSIGADRLTQFCVRVSTMDDAVLQSESCAVVCTLKEEFEAVKNAVADYLAGMNGIDGSGSPERPWVGT